MKNNLILLNEIIKNYDTEDLQDFIATKSNLFVYLSLDLLTEMQENNYNNNTNNYQGDNIILTDITIITINIFEKIKSINPQISFLKKNPLILIQLFKILIKDTFKDKNQHCVNYVFYVINPLPLVPKVPNIGCLQSLVVS